MRLAISTGSDTASIKLKIELCKLLKHQNTSNSNYNVHYEINQIGAKDYIAYGPSQSLG